MWLNGLEAFATSTTGDFQSAAALLAVHLATCMGFSEWFEKDVVGPEKFDKVTVARHMLRESVTLDGDANTAADGRGTTSPPLIHRSSKRAPERSA